MVFVASSVLLRRFYIISFLYLKHKYCKIQLLLVKRSRVSLFINMHTIVRRLHTYVAVTAEDVGGLMTKCTSGVFLEVVLKERVKLVYITSDVYLV